MPRSPAKALTSTVASPADTEIPTSHFPTRPLKRRSSLRSEIGPGGALPDYSLPDHTGTVRTPIELQVLRDRR